MKLELEVSIHIMCTGNTSVCKSVGVFFLLLGFKERAQSFSAVYKLEKNIFVCLEPL